MKQNIHNTVVLNYTGIAVVNIFLTAAVIFLVMYFVVASNMTTASHYRIGLLNEEFSGLMETYGLLTAKKLSIEGSSTILNFAVSHHMIEAGHITHIFESGDVALQN